MLALPSIPRKRGRSGSRTPADLAPPSAAKHGPVGKCQWGSPEQHFCLWSDGETPLSQLKDSPQPGRVWCLTPTRLWVPAHLTAIASASLRGHGGGSRAGISPSISGLPGS